jgi:hypothetical protein
MREFFNNRNYHPIFYAFGAYVVLILGTLILSRQETDILTVAKILVPLCILITLLAAIWMRFMPNLGENSPEIWGRLILGLFFWTAAEVTRTIYFLQGLGQGPFPSLADLLWLLGYVPFIEALTIRYQNFRTRPGKSQFLNIIVFILALGIPLSYLFSLPAILQWHDQQKTLVWLAQLSYILANLAILPFVILALLTFGRGKLFKVWGLFALSLGLQAGTYFLLSYLGRETPFTGRMTAIPTILSGLEHLLLGAGIYGNWLLGQQVALVSQLRLGFIGQEKEIPQFLMNTDIEGKILNLSSNFLQFTNNSLPERYLGKSVLDALNLSRGEFNDLTHTCSQGGFIVNYDVKVAAGQKAPVPLLLTAVGALTAHDYFGLDIALQLPNYSAQAYPLDPESNAIVQEILRRTGQQTNESSAQLAEYFITHIRSFYELVSLSAGTFSIAGMSNEINATATKNNWPIRVNGQEVTIEPGFSNFDSAELLKALPVLFKIAEQYTIRATNARSVEEQTERIDQGLSKSILQTAKYFGLRQG